jgi:DNA-binding NtrC family response regulator
MAAEKINACLVSFEDASDALERLERIFPTCANLPLTLLRVFPALSGRPKIQEALEAIKRLQPELVFLLFRSSHLKQVAGFLDRLKEEGLRAEIVAFLLDPAAEATIDRLKLGMADVIAPPFTEEHVAPCLWRILSRRGPEEALFFRLKEKLGLQKLIGRNAVFLAEVNKIPLVARCDAHVLISGESGTGKEIVARSIHYLSRRAGKPFVAVSCGALPPELFENELFGHERGAFTGALAAQAGLIREAEGGSLFLDDVDCIPVSAQMKMLRFLQEKEYRPLGGARIYPSDTRIIASTNTDLARAVAKDAFRRDLFYRLNVLPLSLPPLRDRREDIELLARHFLRKYGREFDRPVEGFSPGAVQKLAAYDWPGNVRELENVIERAVVFAPQPIVDADGIDLPENETPARPAAFKEAKSQAVSRFEKKYLQELLASHRGNISQSARAACKNRRAFWELIRKHKINPRDYGSSSS